MSPERRSGFEGRTAVFDERASARPEAVLISDACSLTRVIEADRSADRVWIIEESRRLSFIWTSVEKRVFRSKLRGHTFVSERSHLIFSRVKLLEDGEREREAEEREWTETVSGCLKMAERCLPRRVSVGTSGLSTRESRRGGREREKERSGRRLARHGRSCVRRAHR